MILLTGVTGKTGGEIAKQLAAAGTPFRAIARDAKRAEPVAALKGAEVVVGDIGDATFLARALAGVQQALLVMPNGEQQLALEKGFIDAAVKAGVRRVVYLSSLESVPESPNPITQMHVQAETHLRNSGLDWTILRPTFFMQQFLGSAQRIRERSEIAMPIGNGTLAATDLRDVAAVACRVFSEPGHGRQSYDLTGPELLTMHDVVERFSRVLGRPVRYIDQPMDEFRARLKSINLPPWRIEAVVLELSALAAGVVDHTTDTMARLLGRPATSLEQFVRDHRTLFGG
jgi:uncharacterized protein YbjT (DUF2867 family)